MESTSSSAYPSAITISILKAVLKVLVSMPGGIIALYKVIGPFIWNECFAPSDDNELIMAEAGYREVGTPYERTPLLPGPQTSSTPTPEQVALMYNAHLDVVLKSRRPSSSSEARSGNASARSTSTPLPMTPGASHSVTTTPPESTAPSTPGSVASSYFTLREPLYVHDVSKALEAEYQKQQTQALTPATLALRLTPPVTPPASPIVSLSRKLGSVGNQKAFTDDTSYLTASLLCLLHCRDLHEFFLSGRYLDEDIEDPQHQAVINAFASIANFFWPSPFDDIVKPSSSPLLDLSIFHSLFKNLNGMQGNSNPGQNVVQHLLKSLHVALNEGEYCSEQPTYSRTPLTLGAEEDEEALRRHVNSLRNMQAIQEDSIVKDLFEGLTCITSRCQSCHATSASFEAFRVLQMPKSMRPYTTLAELVEDFEKTATNQSRYCSTCQTRQSFVVTKKLWSLPSILILQLSPSSSSRPSTPEPTLSDSPASVASSPFSVHARRRSSTGSRVDCFSLLTLQVDYPVSGLDMSQYDRNQSQPQQTEPTRIFAEQKDISASPSSSYSGSASGSGSDDQDDDVDLNSVSGGTDRSAGETAMYDLFSVRECTSTSKTGGVRYHTYAQDPVTEDWKQFDGGSVSAVVSTADLVTPNADMLFYRRRS